MVIQHFITTGVSDNHIKGVSVNLMLTKPSEEELAREGPTQGHGIHCGIHVNGQGAGRGGARFLVVESAQESRNHGDGEQIVRVGEKSHSCIAKPTQQQMSLVSHDKVKTTDELPYSRVKLVLD